MTPPSPPRRILLLGAGHAHVEVLRRFARRQPPAEIVLVTREAMTPYSGAVPLLLAGHVSPGDAFVDVGALAARAGARLVLGEATGLDLEGRAVRLREGGRVAFDILSIDLGCLSDAAPLGDGAEAAIPARPIGRLVAAVEALAGRARGGGGLALAVVGTGPAGVELAFSLRRRLRREAEGAGYPAEGVRVVLAGRAGRLAPGCNARTRRSLERRLAEDGIPHLSGFEAVAFEGGRLCAADGRSVAADAVVWAAGVRGLPFLAASGLAADDRGFVRVDGALRSLSHPFVFAAGDAAALSDPRPKAGVFAVRAGPVLAGNLARAAAARTDLRRFRPQRRWLALISTGERHAVADRGALSAEGRWIWRWKRRLDRRYVGREP